MADATRKGLFFAAGLLAGGALAVWGYLTFVGEPQVQRPPVFTPTVQPLASAQAPWLAATVRAERPLSSAPPAGSCPPEPALERAGAQDGQFSLQAALATSPGSDPSSFLKVAKEVNASGRIRDAEVALIVACRLAERAFGFQSAPLADAKTELAEHYALLAARERSASQRSELLRRAEGLLADSVQAYTAALGRNASKTRLASRQLEAVGRIPPEPDDAMLEAQRQEADAAGPQASPPPAAQAQAQASLSEPSRPRLYERSEPPIQDTARASDPQVLGAAPASVPRASPLSQLDRDLQRLYAQARSVTQDPGGLQRRHQEALAQRNACRGDEVCLRSWYAQRRQQLFSEF